MARISISPRIALAAVFFFLLFIFHSILAGEGPFLPVFLSSSHSSNKGQNMCVGVTIPSLCPVKCFRADPVCGVDGVTYWCGCAEAACSDAKVASMGICEVGNGGSVPFSAQALLLVHIVWLIVLGFSVIFGLL
ncbi:hypothetical protein TanjilG_10757 [Lupinus angustifolius]|uniref:Kazal-like domain-containing protein n=1 Tax=Lupinus angustifolius TaxID=3871 RepID=A0A1J7IM22_LUPAN|nr:PREDICTED: uncharacterized protein LOC109342356 [Lupinus angustifolius]OIW15317.1 hypothetical protein TanjilG_10757 [Lupinus angustifolius]